MRITVDHEKKICTRSAYLSEPAPKTESVPTNRLSASAEDDIVPDHGEAGLDTAVDSPGHEEIGEAVDTYLEEITPEQLERLPIGEVVQREFQRVVVTEMFSGPLPPPAVLERYAALYPDAPELIFKAFQAQGEHRRRIEDFAVTSNAARSTEGLRYGFTITIACLLVSAYLIMNGHEAAGTAIIAIDLIALVSVFVYGSQQQRQERERKAEAMGKASRGELPPSTPAGKTNPRDA